MYKSEFSIIITSYDKKSIGKKIIDSLLNKKLAACIQIQDIESYYHWEGNIKKSKEKLLLIKTKRSLYKEIENDIISNHNYEIPEIIEIPISSGSSKYFGWIENEVKI